MISALTAHDLACMHSNSILQSVTLKLQTRYPSYKISNFKTNTINAVTFGAALCRVTMLLNIETLVSSLSCMFCNFMENRQREPCVNVG